MYPSQNHTVLGLREPTLEDLRWMAEMACDELLVGEHNWGGENRDVDEVEAELRTAFDIDGLVAVESGTLLVQLDAGDRIGDVSWRTEQWGPSTRSRCPAIGVALLPDFRGRGLGTIAQQLLVDRLFERDQDLHRVQSDTAVDNVAEQRALLKVGMVAEGTVRDAEFRGGRYHDHILFGILRSEWKARPRGAFGQSQAGTHTYQHSPDNTDPAR
jgi:RimJ/RimL family protein N-acetyltransferase